MDAEHAQAAAVEGLQALVAHERDVAHVRGSQPGLAICAGHGPPEGWLTDAHQKPVIREIQKSGVHSFRAIAAALNARGIPTARGGQWLDTTARNALKQAAA